MSGVSSIMAKSIERFGGFPSGLRFQANASFGFAMVSRSNAIFAAKIGG